MTNHLTIGQVTGILSCLILSYWMLPNFTGIIRLYVASNLAQLSLIICAYYLILYILVKGAGEPLGLFVDLVLKK